MGDGLTDRKLRTTLYLDLETAVAKLIKAEARIAKLESVAAVATLIAQETYGDDGMRMSPSRGRIEMLEIALAALWEVSV